MAGSGYWTPPGKRAPKPREPEDFWKPPTPGTAPPEPVPIEDLHSRETWIRLRRMRVAVGSTVAAVGTLAVLIVIVTISSGSGHTQHPSTLVGGATLGRTPSGAVALTLPPVASTGALGTGLGGTGSGGTGSVGTGSVGTGLGGIGSSAPAATATGAAPSIIDARGAVQQYLAAVNARNRSAAAALICSSDLARWQQNANSPNGDFGYTVTGAQFLGANAHSASAIVVVYQLAFSDSTTNTVGFTVIAENGAKLCGIQSVAR